MSALLALLLPLVLGSPAAGDGELFATSSVRPGEGRVVRAAWLADLDGDRLSDLFVATSARGGGARRIAIHLRHLGAPGAPCFAAEPDLDVELTPDVVACCVADVLPDPGRELVLLGARGAYAWRPHAPEAQRVTKILGDLELLWQVPDPERPLQWLGGARDLDGDGHDDLLLPEPGGWLVAWGGAEGIARTQRVRLSAAELAAEAAPQGGVGLRASGRRLELAFPRPGAERPYWAPLLQLSEELPAPRLADWDGDGDLDLLAEGERELYVWRQDKGAFEEQPSVTAPLPIAPQQEEGFDLAFDVREADLDRDGRADLVLLATDQHASDLRTQVLVFPQAMAKGAPPFGDEGIPAQLLVLDGIASGMRLVDVDGDGALDLTCVSFRPDEIDQLVSVASGRIDGRLSVFRGANGRFSARPDLSETVGLGSDPDPAAVRFVPDLNGDGVLELLEHEGKERIGVRLSHRSRGSFGYEADPAWTLAVDEHARLVVGEPGPGVVDLLVVQPHEVLHVRSR